MLRQVVAVSRMNLAGLPARWGASLVVVLSLAGVIGVMVAVLAMAVGIEKTLQRNRSSDRVMVLRTGQDTEAFSRIARGEAGLLLSMPGLARDAGGQPLASVETISVGRLARQGGGREGTVGVRGVSANVLQVRPEVKLVEGRMFTPGRRELLAGRGAQRMFKGLELGAEVKLGGSPWVVVGVFDASGDAHDSELWADTEMVVAELSRNGAYNSITARTAGDAGFDAFRQAVAADGKLAMTAARESEFFAKVEGVTTLIRSLGYIVAVIMALGALFSAVNTLYAAVTARTVEIATLRAIGFGPAPIVMSVLLEALVLCLLGAALGGALAYPLFDGRSFSSTSQGLSQVAFAFRVDAPLLLQGAVWATVIGLLGGLFPAVRAARLPVAEALRPT